jgi:hypothetical protein
LIQDEGALLPDGGSLVKESLRDKGLNMEMQMTWNSLDNLERGKQHKMSYIIRFEDLPSGCSFSERVEIGTRRNRGTMATAPAGKVL